MSSLHSGSGSIATQQSFPRCDAEFHRFACWLVATTWFNTVIMVTIFLNAIIIAVETTSLSTAYPVYFEVADNAFLGVYVVEFFLKIYAEPLGYWKNYYNLFDFGVLIMSLVQSVVLPALQLDQGTLTALRVVRALRTIRTLRSVSFVQGLKVLVAALIQTFQSSVLYLLLLLLILMFLFAVMGYYFFGYESSEDVSNWGNFGKAMLSLFTFVTVDGWTMVQMQLSHFGFTGSYFFTITFIFLGHFIFTNLFIGVVIMNIHSATQEFQDSQREEREAYIRQKKQLMIQRQHEEVLQILEQQKAHNFTFEEMTRKFRKQLRHDDFTYVADLCTNETWMESVMTSLGHLETTKHRCQQLHFSLSNMLMELKKPQ